MIEILRMSGIFFSFVSIPLGIYMVWFTNKNYKYWKREHKINFDLIKKNAELQEELEDAIEKYNKKIEELDET